LENITSIGSIYIYGNSGLINLTGLDGITSIRGGLSIGQNSILSNLLGLENVTYIGGSLCIGQNCMLSSLSGLENVTCIGGGLYIDHNSILVNLSGLDNLNSIAARLYIIGNDSLISLRGLDNVASLGGKLYIKSNDVLSSLSGLDNIDSGSIGNLVIVQNDSLSTCNVQSICDYLASPGVTVEIHDNAPGCNSPEELKEACFHAFIPEYANETDFSISPNPIGSTATVTYALQKNTAVSLHFIDLSGRIILTLTNQFQTPGEHITFIDCSMLSPGVYFCVLKTNPPAGGQTRKILKH